MKKIIALGGKGMTGFYLPEDMPNYDLVDGYDLTIPGVLEKIFEDEKPEVVILLAAVTDVVGAETDQRRCYEVNSMGAISVALLCKKYNAQLIFISSVDVFDGEKIGPYEFFNKKRPIVVYGHSKMVAEEAIRHILPSALIIRAGWMFGGFERDKKFVSYMMKQMTDGRDVVKVVDDIHGSPTYGKDLIAFILEAANGGYGSGRHNVHFCNKGAATRYEQALVIAEVLGYKGTIEKAEMKDFPTFRALKNSVMWSDIETRSWKDALTEYITLWKERIK